jgi:hypothetical protein
LAGPDRSRFHLFGRTPATSTTTTKIRFREKKTKTTLAVLFLVSQELALRAVEKQIVAGNMPPRSYVFGHRAARLSEEKRRLLLAWVRTGLPADLTCRQDLRVDLAHAMVAE